MTKFQSLHEDFLKALQRFEEVLNEPKTPIVRDSAIKRFELLFDLSWKTLKAFLEEYHGVSSASPRNCFKEAFRVGIIDYDEGWLGLIADRNYTVHTYKEAFAEKIFSELPERLVLFRKLAEVIGKSDLAR